ncbi:MAG: SpoIIE family protein phosphatase [Spirochaetes bacterium]|nr:SpoIIE family protein phosphatase [Spirochaetota bacterium]MBU0955887.1 SpoIIE family protein phosphatase [Spirochaetota bacterium]
MSVDERSRFRHEARTFLNHIIGYAELLSAQADSVESDELRQNIYNLQQTAGQLREPVQTYLLLSTADNLSDSHREQVAEAKTAVYSGIYDLISMTQAGRRLSLTGLNRDINADISKIHEAANALVDLIEDYMGAANSESSNEMANPTIPHTAFVESARAKRSGRLLIVDDNEFNRDLLGRHLERQGHVVCMASDGLEAFRILSQAPFDIILLDVMMPGMNGFQFLEALKADEHLREIAVIVISALEEPESIAHCLQMGAEDYFLRQFDPSILRARIDSVLEKKEYKEQKDQVMKRLMDTQNRLAAELRDAATYVRSLLPARLRWGHLAADWAFIPSLSLGGDSFYYQRIGEDKLALYLIDVSGHGIEAALLSVTIMNVLRSLTLGNTDFGQPASVLATLNRSFRIEEQNNMFFTIWYGVYDRSSRVLTYASGGAPPAILIGPDALPQELTTSGCIIGVDEQAVFEEASVTVLPGSHMYLFSDGIFEIRKKDSTMLAWEEYMAILMEHHRECALAPACLSPINRIVEAIRREALQPHFDDDVSIMEFAFNE